MSNLEEHDAEQAEITAICASGECDHPECQEEGNHVSAVILPRVTALLDSMADDTGADTPDAKLRDMLGDLRHYADKHGLDFAVEDASAHDVYLEELS